MTDETQPPLSPQDEQEIESFLSEFAKFSEPDEPPEGQDYLDTGVPTAVENVQAAQTAADEARARGEAAEAEIAEPEEPDALGPTMRQDQLDALLAGDVVAAFAQPDEDAAEASPGDAEQEPETHADEETVGEIVPEESPTAQGADDAPPPEEESDLSANTGEDMIPVSGEETAVTGPPDVPDSEIEEAVDAAANAAAELEPEPVEELSAGADDEATEAIELTGEDLASLVDDGGDVAGAEKASAPVAEAPSVPDLSQDEIDSLFGTPSAPEQAPAESAELSQADIDSLLAGTTEEVEADLAEPEEVVAQLEVTDEELMGLTVDTPGGEVTEAPDLDSLAAMADAGPAAEESPAGETVDPAADAVAAAAVAMEAESTSVDDGEIEALEVLEVPSPSKRLLGLPVRLLAAVVGVPVILIVVVAVVALGRGGGVPVEAVAPAESTAETASGEALAEPESLVESESSTEAEAIGESDTAAESLPEGAPAPGEPPVEAESPPVEDLVEEPLSDSPPESETALSPEPEPLDPAPTPPEGIIGPSPEPAEIEFPEFTFSDPAGDGFNPGTGEPRLILVPAADILNLSVVTTDLRGSPASGRELTEDGFAGAAAGTEITVVLGRSPSELTRGSFRLSLNGRFASATSRDLSPDDAVGLPAGSQLAINIWKEAGTWRGEQVT